MASNPVSRFLQTVRPDFDLARRLLHFLGRADPPDIDAEAVGSSRIARPGSSGRSDLTDLRRPPVRPLRDPSGVRGLIPDEALLLARLVIAGDDSAVAELLRRGAPDPASFSDSFADSVRLLEPTAEALGDLWIQDECTELALTMALVRIQTDFRRCSVGWPTRLSSLRGGRSVLVVPVPGELHCLGAALASEALWRAGHVVDVDFPSTDSELVDEVGESSFDVVHLSLSPSLRRDERVPRLTRTVAALRRASPNPRLRVFVGGRLFREERGAARSVGADAGSCSALQLDGMVRGASPSGSTSALH